MAKNYGTRIIGRITHDSPSQNLSDAPKPRVAEGVMAVVHEDQLAIFGIGSFSNHDYRVTRVLRIAGMRACLAELIFQEAVDLLVAKWVFRNQNNISLTSNTRPESQVSRMTTHHFDHLHPAVRTGRGSRTLNNLSNITQSRVAAQRVICSGQIFVDRFRNPHYRHAHFRQPGGHSERVFAAASYDGIKSQLLDVGDHFC